MQRREFVVGIGSSSVWPLAARAQHSKMPVVGYLSIRSGENYLVKALRRGLEEIGYVEGQSVAIEYRWAMGRYDQLPVMAEELAQRRVDVLVTAGGENAALAAKAATSTIPIVFAIGADPVKIGLVT